MWRSSPSARPKVCRDQAGEWDRQGEAGAGRVLELLPQGVPSLTCLTPRPAAGAQLPRVLLPRPRTRAGERTKSANTLPSFTAMDDR
jgi:hypothetical protein